MGTRTPRLEEAEGRKERMGGSRRGMLERARKEHERHFLFKCLFPSCAIKAVVVVSFLATLESWPGKQEALSW